MSILSKVKKAVKKAVKAVTKTVDTVAHSVVDVVQDSAKIIDRVAEKTVDVVQDVGKTIDTVATKIDDVIPDEVIFDKLKDVYNSKIGQYVDQVIGDYPIVGDIYKTGKNVVQGVSVAVTTVNDVKALIKNDDKHKDNKTSVSININDDVEIKFVFLGWI